MDEKISCTPERISEKAPRDEQRKLSICRQKKVPTCR
jgi:hypothetical protein